MMDSDVGMEMEEGKHAPVATTLVKSVDTKLAEVVRPVAPANAKAVLSWQDLTVTVGHSDKVLINSVSGRCVHGNMLLRRGAHTKGCGAALPGDSGP
jgi:hypothetical protein